MSENVITRKWIVNSVAVLKKVKITPCTSLLWNMTVKAGHPSIRYVSFTVPVKT